MQRLDVLDHPEWNAERTILQELQQRLLRLRVPSEEMHCLGKHRLAYKERRFEFLDARRNPTMVSFGEIKKATKGPVSTIASIAAESRQMFGIRGEVGVAGIDHPPHPSHQLSQPGRAMGLTRGFEGEPQALFDKLSELLAA